MVLQLYQNRLAIEASYMIEEGIFSIYNYNALIRRKRLLVLRRACRNTPSLLDYESMPERFKKEIIKRIPDPYLAVRKNALEEFIHPDLTLSNNLEDYKIDEERHLKPEIIREYYANGVLLDAIRRMRTNNKGHHGKINWEYIAGVVRDIDRTIYPHSLPENGRRLHDRYQRYQREGWMSLIHGNFRNKNAAKVDDEIKESLLIELISSPLNLDNSQIRAQYNIMAEAMHWKKITTATVGVYRDKYDLETYPGRRGTIAFSNKKAMQVKRSAPSFPLYYWTMDGWDVELLYQRVETDKKTGNTRTTYYHRPTIVVILDGCCKYPVGYAIGDHECPGLTKEALRNAMKHTKELLGKMYQVDQLQMDRYAIKMMTPFYEVIGEKVTPARAKNAKAKIIEPYFHYLQKEYYQKCANWSGFGVTSSEELQPNQEVLNSIKKSFPDFDGVCRQIDMIMEKERAKKRDKYLELYSKMPSEHKHELNYAQYLMKLGETTGNKNLMQGSGLHVTINGKRMDYDCFDINFRRHASVRWEIRFDPNDLSKALAVNEDGSLQFMLEEKYIQPMAFIERKKSDYEELQRVNRYNDTMKEHITQMRANSADNVQRLLELSRLKPLANDDEEYPDKDLDTLNKFLITDSEGQHKDERSKVRMSVEHEENEKTKKETSIYDRY